MCSILCTRCLTPTPILSARCEAPFDPNYNTTTACKISRSREQIAESTRSPTTQHSSVMSAKSRRILMTTASYSV